MDRLVGFMYRLLHIEIIRLLKKKRMDPDFSMPQINEFDICKLDPSKLPELSEIKSDEQVWSFFYEPDYKAAKSKSATRNTGSGYWKITGKPTKVKDKKGKVIGDNAGKRILVYYKRVASKMVRTDWVMNEFSVADSPCYKKDFVLSYVEKNPSCKSHISKPDDDQHQPSQSLVSDAETYAIEKTSAEIECQQPSNHNLTKNILEVESEVQSHYNLVPDAGNHVPSNNYCTEEPQLLQNQNLGLDPINNSVESVTQSYYNSILEAGNHVFPNNYCMEAPQILQNQKLGVDYISPMVKSVTQSYYNSILEAGNHVLPNSYCMEEPQLLQNQNLGLDSINNFANYISPTVESERQSYYNSILEAGNHVLPNNYCMKESQPLPNQNLGLDQTKNSVDYTSSMEEPQLLPNQNSGSDPRNNFANYAYPVAAHGQPLPNHTVFPDPRYLLAPNTPSQVDLQQLAYLFAQLSALFGGNPNSVYAQQSWPMHPEHGSSSSYSDGFELEDVRIARRSFQDQYPDQATG